MQCLMSVGTVNILGMEGRLHHRGRAQQQLCVFQTVRRASLLHVCGCRYEMWAGIPNA